MRRENADTSPYEAGVRRVFFLSAVAFCILLLRPSKTSFVTAPAITAVLTFFLFGNRDDSAATAQAKKAKNIPEAVAVSLLLGIVFTAVWLRTLKLVSLQHVDWKRSLPVLVAASVCIPGAVPFLKALMTTFSTAEAARQVRETPPQSQVFRLGREDRRLIFCTAAVAVTVCSLSSPIYPFNNWVDANCFFTVGKSMLYGVVPYRDLYEQKGPLLYALYALAYPLSRRSFFGVWLIEIAAAYAFLSLAYRTMYLILGHKSPPCLLLSALLVYTAPAFLKGGSAEELCLPLMMLSMYYGTEAVLYRRHLTSREALLIGLSSGAVFWVKYSMLGFYAGFVLVPAWRMLREKQVVQLIRILLLILAGVLVASIPVLLYFGLNGALNDLWTAYFYNNIFVYGNGSSSASVIRGLLSGAASMLTFNDSTLLLLFFALIWLFRSRQRSFGLFLGMCFSAAFFVIYMGGVNMKYYSEILCVFIPVAVAVLWRPFSVLLRRSSLSGTGAGWRRWAQVLLPLLFVLALFGNENSEMLRYRKTDLPQYQFAGTIAETEDATLFNYGALDIGQYTVNDLVPTCRYFCMLNIQSDEMFQEMDRYMAEGRTDYIVSRGLPVESPYYELIQTAYFSDDGVEYPYYLYRHI